MRVRGPYCTYVCRTDATTSMSSANIWRFTLQCQILRYVLALREYIRLSLDVCLLTAGGAFLALQRDPGESQNMPGFVVNHGILNSTSLQKLLKASRVGASVWCLVLCTISTEYGSSSLDPSMQYGSSSLNPRVPGQACTN